MVGLSVILNKERFVESFSYLQSIKSYDVPFVITNFDYDAKYRINFDPDDLTHLIEYCKSKKIVLIFNNFTGLSNMIGMPIGLEGIKYLKSLGISHVFFERGYDIDEIALASKYISVVVNATSINEQNINELIEHGVEPGRVIAAHDYFPKLDSGLTEIEFKKKNELLRQMGFQVMAFIPGDEKLAKPLMLRMPTLEIHRIRSTIYAYVDMKSTYGIDLVGTRDESIRISTLTKIYIYDKGVMPLDYTSKEFVFKTVIEQKIKDATRSIELLNSRGQINNYVGFKAVEPIEKNDVENYPSFGFAVTSNIANEFIKNSPDYLDTVKMESELMDKNHFATLVSQKSIIDKTTSQKVFNNSWLLKSFGRIQNPRKGMITIDNENSGMFQGELTIYIEDVNTIVEADLLGYLNKDSELLVNLLKQNQQFKLTRENESDEWIRFMRYIKDHRLYESKPLDIDFDPNHPLSKFNKYKK